MYWGFCVLIVGAVFFRVVVGYFFLGVFLGVFCWAVGWVPWVFRGVLRFFCVLRGALHFLIYTTLLIKKKKKETLLQKEKERVSASGSSHTRPPSCTKFNYISMFQKPRIKDALMGEIHNQTQKRQHNF